MRLLAALRRPPSPALTVLTVWLAACAAAPAWAQQAPSASSIYTCTTPDGRRLTSDRPIPDCASREQRVLNSDGSVRRVMPATMTPEEQAAADARQRAAEAQRAAQQDLIRRDRNLLLRYKDEAAHTRGREAALDDIRQAMQQSEKRLKDLATERQPLLNEAEFYKGKRQPLKLQHALEMNEAAADAQRQSIDNQKAELVRVNKLFDDDLARLRKLWAGAAPGTLEKTGATNGAASAGSAAKPASGR